MFNLYLTNTKKTILLDFTVLQAGLRHLQLRGFPIPYVVDDGTSIEEQTYANCASGAQVKAYIIHNGGHAWSPRESQLEAGGQATGNLDATQVIVDFFLP